MDINKIKSWVSQLTLAEKASLCSGDTDWTTTAFPRLGIPAIWVSDGPYGLRKENTIGYDEATRQPIKKTVPAVCFPAGVTVASSFDTELIFAEGQALGRNCAANNVDILLGPALNIKRSPLCGRNFEYFSEDPLLAGKIAAAYIKGVQSMQVGTSAKHFAANSQEHRRMTSSSEMDERTLREIYLTGFEIAVKEAQPWTIMSSYNRLNGVYASQNKKLLTDILVNDWGFQGFVMSDWGAVHDRAAAVAAGCSLTMPTDNDHDQVLVDAVCSGSLDEKTLDLACERILRIVTRAAENRVSQSMDLDGDSILAKTIAEQSMVLLKNEGALPLARSEKILFVGPFAQSPRYQGGGSSKTKSILVRSALDAVGATVDFCEGFSDNRPADNDRLFAEVLNIAALYDKVVIFAGLPESAESEGYDRRSLLLPEYQNHLIRAVAACSANVTIVLYNGSPVEMPWIDDVNAVLEGYLGGQEAGPATVSLLFGEVNPSGRLAETFPLRLEDTPCYLSYFGEGDRVEYREGVFVGYRYYESKKMPVLFPFGYGLSYTTFEYSNLRLSQNELSVPGELEVSVDVTNTGKRSGREVVQLYIAPHKGEVIRPTRELKAFSKVRLAPGETRTVSMKLSARSFAYWSLDLNNWHVESGQYDIEIRRNARDGICQKTIKIISAPIPAEINDTSLISDLIKTQAGAAYWHKILPTLEAVLIRLFPEYHEQHQNLDVAKSLASNDNLLLLQPISLLQRFMGLSDEAIGQLIAEANVEVAEKRRILKDLTFA